MPGRVAGVDIITLPAGNGDAHDDRHSSGIDVGLPRVTSDLIIRGAGVGQTVVQRDAAAPAMWLARVSNGAQLQLEDLTWVGNGSQGGVYVDDAAQVTVTRTTLTGHDIAIYNPSGNAACPWRRHAAGKHGRAQQRRPLTVEESTLVGQSRRAIFSRGGTSLTVRDSVVTDNSMNGVAGRSGPMRRR